MKKLKLRKAIVSNYIEFEEDDYLDDKTFLTSEFIYQVGDGEYISTINKIDNKYIVPGGTWYKFDIKELVDKRVSFSDKLPIKFNGKLRPNQQAAMDKMLIKDKLYSGIIRAKCGAGKSYMASYLIGTYAKPTIIVCHTKLLAYQWLELLNSVIEGCEIGFMGDGVLNIQPITVAIYKTLLNHIDKVENLFEVQIVDEVHLAASPIFSEVVNRIPAKIRIGMSATMTRKDGKHVLFKDFFGPNVVEVESVDVIPFKVTIIQTDISFNVNPKRVKIDWGKQIQKLAINEEYLNIIATETIKRINEDRVILIISERIEMLNLLNQKIPYSVLLIGGTKNKDREDILEKLGPEYKVVLTTKIFDEGISKHRLDTIILTCPNNNLAKLEQRIGRIQRVDPDKQYPEVVDFWFNGAIVKNQQLNRSNWYNKNASDIIIQSLGQDLRTNSEQEIQTSLKSFS